MCKHLEKMFGFKKLHHGHKHHVRGRPHKQGHNGKLRHCEKHGFGHRHIRSHGEGHFGNLGHHCVCSHNHRPHGHEGHFGNLGHHRIRSHNRRPHGEGHFGHFGHHGRKRGHYKGHFCGRHHGHEDVEENREVAIVEIEEPREIGTQMALLTL